jgi:type I restriction enzyme S subunit
MSEWKEYKFSDFVDVNPTVILKQGSEYSFVEMKDLEDGKRFCYSKIERKLSSGAKFNEGDTLFARITPCMENGKICQVKGLKNNKGFGSTEFLVFRGKNNISDNDFVFYLSRWDEVRGFAESNFEGTSGRQRVPKNCFDNLNLELPPLQEQKTIVSILSSLDNKIDLMYRQNKTLEQIAETLFRQWFVEEAEEDWGIGTLADEFDFTMGQSPPSDSYNDEGNGKIFFQGRTDFDFRFPKIRMFTTQPSRFAKRFDTLISVRAPVGDMNMALDDCCIGRGLSAFRYLHNPDFYSYTYYKMRSLMQQIKLFEDNGTVFGSITRNDFKRLENIIPPKDLIEKFQKTTKPVDDKIFSNHNQITSLTRLRDTLLPKLMSGEVRVKI